MYWRKKLGRHDNEEVSQRHSSVLLCTTHTHTHYPPPTHTTSFTYLHKLYFLLVGILHYTHTQMTLHCWYKCGHKDCYVPHTHTLPPPPHTHTTSFTYLHKLYFLPAGILHYTHTQMTLHCWYKCGHKDCCHIH